MAPILQQTFKDLDAYTQRQLDHTRRELLDYIVYSNQNDTTTAILSRFYYTMDGLSVFVSSNHIEIPNSKLSTHVENFLGSQQVKRDVGSLNVIKCPVSKNIRPDNALYQNCRCLTSSRLLLLFVTYLLFLNTQYQILSQNAKTTKP